MEILKPVKCRKGHDPVIIPCDLSKAYAVNNTHWMVRCDVKPTCCFSDYFPTPKAAVIGWNEAQERGV